MFKETLRGFKTFILRGNVIDLAVGIMIGAAFNSVISSLVKDILTPFIAAIVAKPDFSKLSFTIHGSQFAYGDFLNNLFSFLITAIAVYFFVVLPINKLNQKLGRQQMEFRVTSIKINSGLKNSEFNMEK